MLSQNFILEQDPLSLERIRSVLVRLEDTIIFDLIERAQFAHNPRMYVPGAFSELKELGFEGSWLEWFLKEIETFHGPSTLSCSKLSPVLILAPNHPTAKARRYTRYGIVDILPPSQLMTTDTVQTNTHLRMIFPRPF